MGGRCLIHAALEIWPSVLVRVEAGCKSCEDGYAHEVIKESKRGRALCDLSGDQEGEGDVDCDLLPAQMLFVHHKL